ncbi:MAG TPA: right-handed parallel beta-helix repeat-containing protein, partial [Rugosimonospora sp.]|nr:right-handed parallel beta-helix repeat-containing protein [Rugosimonospora sp.]
MAAKVLRVGPGGRGRYPTILAALAASGTDDTVISVAPGDYPQALVLGSNVEIRAEAGRGTVHLRPSGGGTPVEVRSGTVTLRGLVLHGTRADGVALAVGGGTVLVQECDVDSTGEGIGVTGGRVTVTGCTVRATGYGIGFLNAGGLVERCAIGPVGTSCVVVQGGAPVLRDCVLTTAGGNGLYLHTGSTGSYDDCEITGTTLAAVALNSAANPTVNRANIHHVAQGISVEGAFGVFADCTVRDTAGTLPAVRVAGGGAPRFTRLGVHDPAYQAVLVEGNSTPQFDDCTLIGSGSSAFAAMSGARPTVRRAGIRAAQGNGIYVDAASGVFEDCEVTGCALPGVALTNGADPTLRRVRVHRAANLAVLVKAAQGRFEDCVVEHTDANRNAVTVEEKSAPRFDGLTLTGVGGTAVVVRSASTPAMRRVTVGPGALAALVVDAAGGEYTGWSVGALPGHVTAAVGLRNAVEGTRLRDFRLSEVEAGVVVRGGHAGVSGLRVDQARRYGLRTDDGATVLVRDCELTGCAEWGVRLGPGDTRLHGVRVTGCGNGVEVGTGATARLDGCVVTGNRGLGVRVLSTGEVVLAGCTVDDNALRDVAVEPGAHPRVEPASGAPGQPAVAPDAAGRDPAPGTTEPGSGIAAPAGASPQLRAALAGLDALIGLGRVKEEIARLIDF